MPTTDPTSIPLRYAVTHVFLPIEKMVATEEFDLSLARSVCIAAHAYSERIHGTLEHASVQWYRVGKMLDNLQMSIQSGKLDGGRVVSKMSSMCTGDILAIFIRPRNAAVILTRQEQSMLCELFEVSPSGNAGERAAQTLTCSYPSSAIETPNEVFDDGQFQICCDTNAIRLDLPPLPTRPAGILRGTGRNANVFHITKRVYAEHGSFWRRSSVLHLIKVAMQMSCERSCLGRDFYKRFMLFFICTLARDANDAGFSSHQLQLMGCKILRRLTKLGSSNPNWLSEMAREMCARLQETLDARLPSPQPYWFRNPSEEELIRDTQLSLLNSGEYIRSALADPGHEVIVAPFHPNHHHRGNIENYLSSDGVFFEEAYDADPDVTLYDVEQSVQQGIDDWSASVTDVEEACTQLGILIEKYMKKTKDTRNNDVEMTSISFLTSVELFVALDKLVVNEIPILADYSPEIPVETLEKLHLRYTTGLHRLSRVYQYLSARQSRSRPGWSVLSDGFTKDSFPVRYYDQSPDLQLLKARVEADATQNISGSAAQSPLPLSLIHSKVVIFELQSPACLRIWRSIVAQILICFLRGSESGPFLSDKRLLEYSVLPWTPELRPYFIEHKVSSKINLYRTTISGILRYVAVFPDNDSHSRSIWIWKQGTWSFDLRFPPVGGVRKYADSTSHTSNDVLAVQVHCPDDLPLDEFITFGHLRSGGSLQWLNILHGLHARTLNFRREEVHYLLSRATSQVGPLDLNTGAWIWHQELQDSSFCNALLDELECLFVDTGASSIDRWLMNTISLVLTRVLASSPSKDVLDRVVLLLRSVRRKTFNWVEELSYNLRVAPTNEERSRFLLEMVLACQSTFDIDRPTLSRLCLSAEDVDAFLTCALFIHTLHPGLQHDRALVKQGRRLSLVLEPILRDAILADPSDYGVDLAVSRIFAIYHPGTYRWEQLQSPNARWLTCRTEATLEQPSQTLHLDLLIGELRVDGRPAGGLPSEIRHLLEYREIFCDQGFFVVPSNLPGMDFTTLGVTSKYKVHFSLRNDGIMLRAQCNPAGDIFELIPSSKLREDLPSVLVSGHIHWLNLSTKNIEIRPREQLWEESSENWKIVYTSTGYFASKGHEILVDIQSPTWKMLCKCLRSVCSTFRGSSDTLVTLHSIDSPKSAPVQQLFVALPHAGLSFFANDREELESCDFKDMVYDENQCVGTLFGSEKMLVLRPKTHIGGRPIPDALIPRRILMPENLTYNVDTDLGWFVGNGDLENVQNLADLHATTNCYKPDPLTGKTGAQAAVCLLQSAGCRSIMKLKSPRYVLELHAHMGIQIRYPEISAAYDQIRSRYYWNHDVTRPTGLSSIQLPWPIILKNLFDTRRAPGLPSRRTLLCEMRTSSWGTPELHQLFSSLKVNKSNSFQEEYLAILENSAQYALQGSRTTRLTEKDCIDALEKHYVECRAKYTSALGLIRKALGPASPLEQALEHFGLRPPTTADYLLRCLATTSSIKLPPDWKRCFTSLALLLLDLQRARRLLRFTLDGLEDEFSKELENEGCDGWNPEEYPDWLLIQIQGNFLIRRTQAEAAMQMISPQSGNNTVMQVNVGEGKSSIIIPIVAAALADGKQLVRVIVPKALRVQMFDILVARLGGLANRPIFHLPFSRTPKQAFDGTVITPNIDNLHKLMSQCMVERGILLVQPEDVTSLKLMGVEQQIRKCNLETDPFVQHPICKQTVNAVPLASQFDNLAGGVYRWMRRLWTKNDVAPGREVGCSNGYTSDDRSESSKWLDLQRWIHFNVRDILDESDDILHPRFQLIYTAGLERHMDGFPDRWTITQTVLQLARKHIHILSRNHPNSIEYECSTPGSFPHVYVVRASEVGRRLMLLIVKDVMAGRIPSFNFQTLSPELQGAISSFISDQGVLEIPETAKRVEEYAKGHKSHLWDGLLLLRGLLACNILLFALSERRWRVDYGLSSWALQVYWSTRTMLAVPYRAKDVPAPDTQFGHPDVTIILTCLSYYYEGLTEEQLRLSFKILLDQDNPSAEYAHWTKEYDGCVSLSDSLLKLSEINLKSSEQWDKVIFPLFSRNQVIIDFYLSRVVFPNEAKEFPWKLSASSWDLAEKKEKLTTGCSGTNDTQWLLPMSIAQHDLDKQIGSNAKVLAHLLQPENDFYTVINELGEQRSTIALLRLVTMQRPEIRVLIDVGAQILDFSNRQVAEAWLKISHDTAASGAIYFNENDELMVLTRNDVEQRMASSSFSQRLDRCVVYLDHAHTRGTDLKLPVGSRAAVTLGPKLTKDSLVQGCMRMRKLGHGHSVMFFAPVDIDQSIRSTATKKDPDTQVTTVDILCWAIHETWTDIQHRAPYWAQQGMNHKLRYEALSRFCNDELAPDKLKDAWLQPESKSLANMYAPCEAKSGWGDLSELDPGIRQRCKTLGILSLPSAQMDEEQEREVNREREREREIQLPPSLKAEPAEHFLHPDLVKFVKTGKLPILFTSGTFYSVFKALPKSHASSRSILATADFCKTIKLDSTPQTTMDRYLRPVQWIITRSRTNWQDQSGVLVILSPFEANRLMPIIRASEHVHLHLYAPRTSRRMKPSDDLKFYVIPPLPSDWIPPWDLIDQLNVFSGQLYLRDYDSYLRVCRFLGIATKVLPDETAAQWKIQWELLNLPSGFGGDKPMIPGSSLSSVTALLEIRSRGRRFVETHMGKILQGQPLTQSDFED